MAGKAKRVAIYARVSTDGQTVDNQLAELGQVAERHGWDVVCTHVDEGVSGAKGRDRRPGFDALCTAVARREVDMVAAWSVDRLGRSLRDLVTFLGEFYKPRTSTSTCTSRGSTRPRLRGGPCSACWGCSPNSNAA